MSIKRIEKLEVELSKRNIPKLSFNDCFDLYQCLEHGEQKHKDWLWEAILAWSLNKEKPTIR